MKKFLYIPKHGAKFFQMQGYQGRLGYILIFSVNTAQNFIFELFSAGKSKLGLRYLKRWIEEWMLLLEKQIC